MRTWKMEGPPEIVEGMVMKVMTSCSLRPARRARKPPMAWMPSCELPAKRMTASDTLDTWGALPAAVGVNMDSLIGFSHVKLLESHDKALPKSIDTATMLFGILDAHPQDTISS